MNRIAGLLKDSPPPGKLHERCQCEECRTIRRLQEVESAAREIDPFIDGVAAVCIPSADLIRNHNCRVRLVIVGETREYEQDEDLREYAIAELRRLAGELAEAAERLEGVAQ